MDPELFAAALEILRGDLVEELLELVDDLLCVLDLVLELDRRLLDHFLGRPSPDLSRLESSLREPQLV